MSKIMKKPSIIGLDDYGLSLRELISLKGRMIKVKVYTAYINTKPLFPFSPQIRRKKMDELRRGLFNKLKAIWPSNNYTQIGSKRKPGGIYGLIKATEIRKLLNKNYLDSIWIKNIEGIRKKENKKEKTWFAVKANFAIEIEGQTRGLQDVEERIAIVKADDCKDAEKKLIKNFKGYGTPYLNKYGEMVRWHFEKIVDVYDMNVDSIDPKGTEIYYEFKCRRMKPAYEWHPLRKMKKTNMVCNRKEK